MIFVWGNPIYIARDIEREEMEKKRKELEETLLALTEKAERLCGESFITS